MRVFIFHRERAPILQPLPSETAQCSSAGTVCETTLNSCHTGSGNVQQTKNKINSLIT